MTAHSILLLGPSGTGKSSFLREAMVALGSGVIAMAPGDDELNSYHGLAAPNYLFKGFDDPDFQPINNSLKATGLAEMTRWLQSVYKQISDHKASTGQLLYNVVGVDTITAAGRLAFHAALSKFSIQSPPAAQSKDGAAFYGYLYQIQEGLMATVRAFKGLGVHIIATGHVSEKENMSEASTALAGAKQIVPSIPGGFRDALPSFFDLVLHAGVAKNKENKNIHYLQWRPSTKRPTKSRWGDLDSNELIPNNWKDLMARLDKITAVALTS